MAPAQRVAGGVRRGVGQDGQDEGLGVPEGVPVVAGPGQALGGDRAPLAAGARLQGVKEREAHRLLELGVAFQLDVGALPEVVQVAALVGEQSLPAGVPRLGQRRGDLIAQRRRRAPARPSVGDELDHAQPLARLDVGHDRHAPEVLAALRRRLGPGRALDDVIHAGRHPQRALAGDVHEHGAAVAMGELLGAQHAARLRRGAGIGRGGRHLLVGHEL